MNRYLILAIFAAFAILLQPVLLCADVAPEGPIAEQSTTQTASVEEVSKPSRMKPADLPPAIAHIVEAPIAPLAGIDTLEEKGYVDVGGRPEVLIDTKRAGFKRYYEEGRGFKIFEPLSVSGRFEIVENFIPVDSYIMAANEKSIRGLNNLEVEDTLRDQIRHSMTRAVGATAILDLNKVIPSDKIPGGQIPIFRYTYDKRQDNRVFDEVLNDFKVFDKWTHEFFLEYRMPFKALALGDWIINAGYQKYWLRGIKNRNSFERRNNWIFNNAFQIDKDRQIFFAYEYFQGKRLKATFIGKTEQHFYRFQWRQRFPQWRLFSVTNYSATREDFRPDPPLYQKHEIYQEFNKDITDKLRFSQKTTVIASRTSNGNFNPSKVDANALIGDIKASYEIIPSLDLSFEYQQSFGMTNGEFDNALFLWEAEVFKPGLLRTSIGYFYQYLYNIGEQENGIQFRAFLFQ